MKNALATVEGISNIETDVSSNTCKFKAAKGLDVKQALDKLAEGGNAHIKDWTSL